jgi:hypothetical protein
MINRLRDNLQGSFSTCRDLFASFTRRRRSRRFLVLLPFLLVIALLLAIVASSGALAPFVYPLF